ncbi:adenylate kinase isoenzyme 1-like [Pteropus alecto]|uniref:adenylate kinase isoenzyme 1-like n=1 Tax=Pteropus alecto TaxID=9402 RepID=UPI000D53A709|nr:adenylate kinase isoenzyme 1-like [Pteropus alecto]
MMGGPGCSKETQCKNMATKYGFCLVGLGQLLWQEAQSSTRQGWAIQDIMLQGLLVPTVGWAPVVILFDCSMETMVRRALAGPRGALGRLRAGRPLAPADTRQPVLTSSSRRSCPKTRVCPAGCSPPWPPWEQISSFNSTGGTVARPLGAGDPPCVPGTSVLSARQFR